jgi:DNA gyrase subunit A
VGEVLGKYHPHGDSSVYDALVRMVQSFSLRYPLIIGQGNFGSIDGDAAAAYRYTEAKLSEMGEALLKDIEKNVIPLVPNFDGKLKEPTILPAAIPNLLINGSSGIAVGMATNIPPHNLGEVIDALVSIIDGEDDIYKYIKGPDFPTGGIIEGTQGIQEAYQTGKGKIIVKGKTQIEELKDGRERICIVEIPYLVNKAQLIAEIVENVRIKRIEGIIDVRDESDREGMRIIIELKNNAPSQIILNQLFKHTNLMTTYGINLVAIKDGIPKLLTLKELLTSFLNHRYLVIKTRSEYELKEKEEKAHILEGLKVALLHIDEIVNILRKSEDEEKAKEKLVKKFNLSPKQVKAIMDMRLGRLIKLEQEKIEKEYFETIKEMERLRTILQSKEGIMAVVKEELLKVKLQFQDERRTKIVEGEGILEIEDLIPNTPTIVILTEKGYIKRSKSESYPRQRRGGKGVKAITLVPDDNVLKIFETLSHSKILLITQNGRCFSLKVYKIPEMPRSARGRAINNFIELKKGEKVVDALPIEEGEEGIIVTTKGKIKKINLKVFENIRITGIKGFNVKEGDEVVGMKMIKKEENIFIFTEKGKVVRFESNKLRKLSRQAGGVRGIKLKEGDKVIGVTSIKRGEGDLFVVTKKGFGKRVEIDSIRVTNRGCGGVICSKLEIAGGEVIKEEDEILLITKEGKTLKTWASSIRKMSRVAKGVKIVNLNPKDEIIHVCKIGERES